MSRDPIDILIYGLATIAILWFLAVCLTGCRTPRVVTEYREVQVHDTTLHVDSVWRDRWHTIYTKGDTVFVHDSVFVDRYKYRDKVREVQVRDSIPYPVEVTKEVHVRNGYDRFVSWFFWVVVVGGLLALAGWLTNKKWGWWKIVKMMIKTLLR